METSTPAYTDGSLLFFEVFFFHGLWWITYVVGEPIFKWLNPSLHERLNAESREKKLLPVITFFIRIIFGLLITVPSCTYAAIITPWGAGQPLNRAGQVCMASQVTYWAAETGIIINYSFEMFVHHIICMLITANVVLSPKIHPIRPLYIYFAIQLGDISAGSIHILKTIGRRPHNSKLLYRVLIAGSIWIVSSKVTSAFWSIGNSLQSPYRVADWLWCFCLLLWASYILLVAYRNLRWAQVFKEDPLRPYSIVCFGKITVPTSHLTLGAAFSATILSTLFIYGIYHHQELTPSDLNALATLSIVGTALGLTSAMALRVAFPVNASQTDPWGRDIYVQAGAFIVGWWAYCVTGSVSTFGRNVAMSALALNVPLFQALAKVSYYCSARDAATHYLPPSSDDEDEKEEKPIPKSMAMARLDKSVMRKHLGMAQANLAIFLISVGLLAGNFLILSEAGTLAVVSSLASQLIRSPCMLYGSFNESSGMPFLHALLTCVGIVLELAGLLFKVATRKLNDDNTSYLTVSFNYTLIAVTTAASFAFEYVLKCKERESSVAKETAQDEAVAKKRHWMLGPKGLLILCLFAAQVTMCRAVVYYSDTGVLQEPGIWFTNFRLVLTGPQTWAAVTAAGLTPMLLFKTLDMEAIRAYREATALDLFEQW